MTTLTPKELKFVESALKRAEWLMTNNDYG